MSDVVSPRVEAWREDFRHRVKQELLRRRMRQHDLAVEIGYANSSSVNYHLAGRGPSLDFVRRISQLWPDTFGNEMEVYLAAVHGREASDGIAALHQKNILDALDEMEVAFQAVRRAMTRAFENFNDDHGQGAEDGEE
jgi:transcriptional regulator with XRE-family HTH domain